MASYDDSQVLSPETPSELSALASAAGSLLSEATLDATSFTESELANVATGDGSPTIVVNPDQQPRPRRDKKIRRPTIEDNLPARNVKHLEHDYDFYEEPTHEFSWLTLPTEQFKKNNLSTEKSQHTAKQENDENEFLEPFARECLHLFNGEWTVMDPNREQLKFEIAPPTEDYKYLMRKTNEKFEPATKRSRHHPQSFFERLV